MKKSAIRIDTPCQMDWASMTPADRGRFCGDCKKVVHELVRMTEAEARALLHSAKNGELCVRYVFDEQGNVFFSDTPRLVQPSFLNRAKRVAAIAAAVTVPMTIGCSGLSNGADGSSGSSGHMMGGIGPSDDYTIAQPLDSDASDDAESQHDAKADGGADASEPDSDPADAAPDTYVPPT